MIDNKARIDKIKFITHRPERKNPEAGDKKIIKNVMHVRCYEMALPYGTRSHYIRTSTRGKSNFIWIRESEADLEHFLPKHCVEHNRKRNIVLKERERSLCEVERLLASLLVVTPEENIGFFKKIINIFHKG